MNTTQEQVKNATIIVGMSVGMTNELVNILINNNGLYETIKHITVELFILNRQQYFERNEDVYDATNLIREYLREMKSNECVIFKN